MSQSGTDQIPTGNFHPATGNQTATNSGDTTRLRSNRKMKAKTPNSPAPTPPESAAASADRDRKPRQMAAPNLHSARPAHLQHIEA